MLLKRTRRPYPRMTPAQERKVKKALEHYFRAGGWRGPSSKDARTWDFVFHMTDWYGDLVRLARVMQKPNHKSAALWEDALNGFVIHVSGHLLAATKLRGIKPCPFDIPMTARPAARRSARKAR